MAEKNKRGRPKKPKSQIQKGYVRVVFDLPPQALENLDKAGERNFRSRTNQIRWILMNLDGAPEESDDRKE